MTSPLRISGDVLIERFDDAYVIVHIPSEHVFALHGSAGTIFGALSQGASISEIEAQLVDAFGIDAHRAQTDVAACVSELVELGAVEHV